MYFAHLSSDKKRKQSVLEHLQGTARRSGDFAAVFGCREWGEACGLFHDIGKYSDGFQRRLNGGPKVDHSTAGAKEFFDRKHYLVAYCIAGHHSGLMNGRTTGLTKGTALCDRVKKALDHYQAFSKEVSMPVLSLPPLHPLGSGGFSLAFFTRMLFSGLVDADFLDTEAFMTDNPVSRGGGDPIDTLLERLKQYVAPWIANQDAAAINVRRNQILKACFDNAGQPPGLFQLTVPTGGGKTVSSLAFALQHAKEHQLKRIIYVIPYTSIIEQNARIFKAILGDQNVLEDHSNVTYDSPEELAFCQLAAENWDRPVVVTTNVQFFESLYANKPSKCRKLHNIAKSVIVFDEVQMLPAKYLKPCVRAISELVYNYHCSAVLCTATQPSLHEYFPDELKLQEICPDVKQQFDFFRRTTIQTIGGMTEAQLIQEIQQHQQVLCIVNSRKRAQRIYQSLEGEHIFHLSTFMYPADRIKTLELIRTRLKEGRACCLIATCLVEAGVDLDFQMVYRELAGIDSIIQANGRCNRENKKAKELCKTLVFEVEDTEDIHIPSALKQPIEVAKQIVRKYSDISSPEAIGDYFSRLFRYKGEGLDVKQIVDQFERGARTQMFPFADIAGQFRMIEQDTRTILIDIEPEAKRIAEQLRCGKHSRQLLRDAGQYCVNTYIKDFDLLNGAGLLEQIDQEFYVLRKAELYTKEQGLVVQAERGDALFA